MSGFVAIGGARQSGKTTHMIEWLRGDPERMLVTFNMRRCQQLRADYEDVSDQITFHNPQKPDKMVSKSTQVGFDDIDIFLSQLYGVPCTRVSFTGSMMHTNLQ